MKQYMMIFRMTPDFSTQPTEAELEQMHQSWGKFIGNIAIQEKLVGSHQLGYEGSIINADGSEQQGLHLSEGETLSGLMIVKAQNLNEATQMSKDCPILQAGGNVEVRSFMPTES